MQSNTYQALVHALTLGLTAPTDLLADRCSDIAEEIARGLTPDEVHRAKDEAALMVRIQLGVN